ncbi:MAG TPA: hypothetical protein VFC93_11355 [Chloroflexota bacterium]|nr:hypothetical protein [Chloroflexota bacterium]
MVKAATTVRERIEQLLTSLRADWERLPTVEAEIGGWDLLDQLTFVEEWPLVEQKLDELARYADEGQLTPAQAARYRGLLDVVERNRPIIQRLRES